jgi:hypothetical protein
MPPATTSLRLDRLEWLLLGTFAAVSVWVLGLDLWRVLVHGRTWTGTDGVYITDQAQYLGWVVSASHSGLVANLFVIHPTSAVYLQPAIVVSGLLAAIGVPPTIALLMWKPIAVVAMFFAVRAITIRVVGDRGAGARGVAMTLALFYGCLTPIYGSIGVVGDLFPGFLSWGYPFALLAIAAMIYGLLGYERARADGGVSLVPGVLGALASSLHPWQGELFVLVLAATELTGGWRRRPLRDVLRSSRVRLAALTIGPALVPIVYYALLSKLNIDWQLGQAQSKHEFPAPAVVVALAPLVLVASLGYRGPAGGFLGRATRLWPLAALAVCLQSLTLAGGAPLHAFGGVTVPLALLAVNGCIRVRNVWPRSSSARRVTLAVALALGTLPSTYEQMREAFVHAQPTTGDANFILPGERHALAYLKRDRDPGGVLSSRYLGMLVPGYTGRHTYDGNCIWSQPDCKGRNGRSKQLLTGRLDPARAQQVVTNSHARFVLVACGSATGKLEAQLRPLTSAVTHFGCASVIEIGDKLTR